MSVSVDNRGLGRIKDRPDERDHPLRRYLSPVRTPARYSRLAQLGPVTDQGNTPQCVAYSSSTLKTHHERRQHRRTYLFDQPRLYAECKQRDGIPEQDGTYIRTALDLLRHGGAGRQGRVWEQDAPRYRIERYARLHTIAEIEETIRYVGAVIIGMDWSDEWRQPQPPYILDTPRGFWVGGHAFVIAGYDRRAGLFEMRNSWGTGWADQGCARITYREVERQLNLPEWRAADCWAVVDYILERA